MVSTRNRRAQRLAGFLSLLFLPPVLLAADPQSPSPTAAKPTAAFVLTVHDQRVSLEAREASVKAIVEELGRRLHIPVTFSVPAEKTVTVAFAQLSVEEALERLKAVADIDYFIVYRKFSPAQAEQITRIEVVAKGTGAMAQPPAPRTAGPAVSPAQGQEEGQPEDSFGFEFDPSRYMKEHTQ